MNGLRLALLALLAIGLVAWVRVVMASHDAMETAAAAEASGDEAAAVEHYQYAMRWYSPFASTPAEAADALWRLGDAATARGDRAAAMAAFRRLRGGILATRGLTCPFCDLLDPVNQRLAVLIAAEQQALGQPTIRGRSREALVADHLALLRLDPIPHPGWALLAVLGFFAWVAGGFLVVFRGLDPALRRTPAFARWAGLTAVGFAAWLLGLWQA